MSTVTLFTFIVILGKSISYREMNNGDFLKEVNFFFPFDNIPVPGDQHQFSLANNRRENLIKMRNEKKLEYDHEWQKVNNVVQKFLRYESGRFVEEDRVEMKSEECKHIFF